MMFNRQNSLWMGDLDPYMDENFVKQAFSGMGESPLGVKIITHRITGGSAGYCFVELADEASVDRCVQRLNGKLVPGSNPTPQTDIEWIGSVRLLVTNGKLVKKYGYCEDQGVSVQQN